MWGCQRMNANRSETKNNAKPMIYGRNGTVRNTSYTELGSTSPYKPTNLSISCTYRDPRIERHARLPRRAGRRFEGGIEANPQLVQKPIIAGLHPDHIQRHAGIRPRNHPGDLPRSDPSLGRQPAHVRQPDALIHRAGAGIIIVRSMRHAGTVLRPLMLHQANGRYHAEIARNGLAAQGRCGSTELRPAMAPIPRRAIRPEAMQHKAKAADRLVALHVIALSAGAILRSPAQRQRIAADRHPPHFIGPGYAAATRSIDPLRYPAGGYFGMGNDWRRQRRQCEASRQPFFKPSQNQGRCPPPGRTGSSARR